MENDLGQIEIDHLYVLTSKVCEYHYVEVLELKVQKSGETDSNDSSLLKVAVPSWISTGFVNKYHCKLEVINNTLSYNSVSYYKRWVMLDESWNIVDLK